MRIHTKEECIAIAKTCKTLKEFRLEKSKYYYACQRNGWLEDIRSILPLSTNISKRCVYVILFENKVAYVGLTWNLDERINGHLHKAGAVFDYIQENNVTPIEIKQLTDYIIDEEAAKKEKEYIIEYQKQGFSLLNKDKGGTLGRNYLTYSIDKEKCKVILEKLNYNIKEFRKNYKKQYTKCLANKWFYELVPNYEKCFNPKYNHDNLIDILHKCQNRNEFKLNYVNYYRFAIKKGILEDLYNEVGMGSTHIPNKIGQYEKTDCIFIYENVQDACDKNEGYKKSSIYNAIRRKIKAYGYYWKYVED